MLVMLDFVCFCAAEPMHAKGLEGEAHTPDALRGEEWRAHAPERMWKGLACNKESQRGHKKNMSSGTQSEQDTHRATRCAGTTLTTDW